MRQKGMLKTYRCLSLMLFCIANPILAGNLTQRSTLSASVTIQHRLALSFPEGNILPPLVVEPKLAFNQKVVTAIPYCIFTNKGHGPGYTVSVSGALKSSGQAQEAILPYQLNIIDGSGIENNYIINNALEIEGKYNFTASTDPNCLASSGPNAKGHIALEISQETLQSAPADTYSGSIHLLIQEV